MKTKEDLLIELSKISHEDRMTSDLAELRCREIENEIKELDRIELESHPSALVKNENQIVDYLSNLNSGYLPTRKWTEDDKSRLMEAVKKMIENEKNIKND